MASKKITVMANSPLRHWGLERGQLGEIEIGDGTEGTVTQADFDARVELGHAAVVEKSKSGGPASSESGGDTSEL